MKRPSPGHTAGKLAKLSLFDLKSMIFQEHHRSLGVTIVLSERYQGQNVQEFKKANA